MSPVFYGFPIDLVVFWLYLLFAPPAPVVGGFSLTLKGVHLFCPYMQVRVDKYFWHGKTCDAQIEEFKLYPEIYEWLLRLGDFATRREKYTGKQLGEFFRIGRELFDKAGLNTSKFKAAVLKCLLLSTVFYGSNTGAAVEDDAETDLTTTHP